MVEVEQLNEITLGDGLGEVAIRVNGVRVEVHTSGDVDVYGDVDVASHRAPLQTPSPRELKIGDAMPDGTKYAGISPDTGKPMYAAASDAPLTMKWKQAMEHAARFEAHGQPKGSFHVPTKGELNVLFENQAKIGGFNQTGSSPGWYWSSTENRDLAAFAHVQYFSDGYCDWHHKGTQSSLRLVRG